MLIISCGWPGKIDSSTVLPPDVTQYRRARTSLPLSSFMYQSPASDLILAKQASAGDSGFDSALTAKHDAINASVEIPSVKVRSLIPLLLRWTIRGLQEVQLINEWPEAGEAIQYNMWSGCDQADSVW
jgi:hypothetical protein